MAAANRILFFLACLASIAIICEVATIGDTIGDQDLDLAVLEENQQTISYSEEPSDSLPLELTMKLSRQIVKEYNDKLAEERKQLIQQLFTILDMSSCGRALVKCYREEGGQVEDAMLDNLAGGLFKAVGFDRRKNVWKMLKRAVDENIWID